MGLKNYEKNPASESKNFTSQFACSLAIYCQVQCKMCLYDAILVNLEEKELSFLMGDHELPVNMMIFVLA